MSAFTNRDILVTKWEARFLGRRFPCAIGRGGLTSAKREGDAATPRGLHTLPKAMYRPDRISPLNGMSTLPSERIVPGDIWCDAPEHSAYNQKTKMPFAFSHEKLRRSDRLYDLILISDWNWPVATPNKGSAIFVHRWRKPRHPTEGCVAFRSDHLRWIAERITHKTRLIIR